LDLVQEIGQVSRHFVELAQSLPDVTITQALRLLLPDQIGSFGEIQKYVVLRQAMDEESIKDASPNGFFSQSGEKTRLIFTDGTDASHRGNCLFKSSGGKVTLRFSPSESNSRLANLVKDYQEGRVARIQQALRISSSDRLLGAAKNQDLREGCTQLVREKAL